MTDAKKKHAATKPKADKAAQHEPKKAVKEHAKPKAADSHEKKPAETQKEHKPEAHKVHKPVEEAGKAHKLKGEAKPEHKPAKEKPVKEEAPLKEEAKKDEKPAKKKAAKPKPKPVEKIKFTGERKLTKEEFALIKDKPRFQRPEARMYKCLSASWRRPQGIDSKQLEGKRGKPAIPSAGYKKPDEVSGLVKGFKHKRVENPQQVVVTDPKTEAIIIAGNVGRKKRNEIIKVANEKKITILNPRRGET